MIKASRIIPGILGSKRVVGIFFRKRSEKVVDGQAHSRAVIRNVQSAGGMASVTLREDKGKMKMVYSEHEAAWLCSMWLNGNLG